MLPQGPCREAIGGLEEASSLCGPSAAISLVVQGWSVRSSAATAPAALDVSVTMVR
jgi:hypothetical protein